MANFLSRLFGRGRKAVTEDGDSIVTLPPAFTEYLHLYGTWGSYAAMYRHQPAVRTVVDFLARNVAQLSAKVYERVGDADRLELNEHELAELMRRPSGTGIIVPNGAPRVTRYRLFFGLVADLGVYDRAYWLKVRQNRRVRALMRVPPQSVWPEYDHRTGNLTGYRTPRGRIIRPSELVVFPGYDPATEGGSISPLETLRRILAEEWAAGLHRENFWRNASRHEGVIQRPLDAPEWSEDARRRFREDWQAAMAGAAAAGKTGILEDGMEWKDASFSPRDSEYIAGRELTREEVARAYHIPPPMVGILKHSNFSNMREAHRQLYADTLGPWLTRIEEEIEVQLLPEFEAFDSTGRVYVEFNIKEKLKGSFLEEAQVGLKLVGVPPMTINEWRARQNLPRIDEEWADIPVRPANIVYGGQPGTTEPLPPPPTDPGQASRAAKDAQERREHAAFLREARSGAEKKLAKLLTRTFERQRSSVLSGGEFNRERWDRELGDDLRGAALQITMTVGEDAASRVSGEYDAARTVNFLKEWADRTAREINDSTQSALAAAEEPREVFETALGARSVELTTTLTTFVINWVVQEVARQNG